ncbi:MAG: S46 family peptidase [Ignavibacterium sp.]|nr:MAG: S46 family peptidase [Ignavibacterium sp.]
MKKLIIYLLLLSAFVSFLFAQQNYNNFNLDTVKAGRFDTGKMWAFEYPPTQYLEEEYGFTPDDEWFENVRLGALRFATYCSASFVSADGLVMTNHHCSRQSLTKVTWDDEDHHTDGFIATNLKDERRVPELFVDQLVLIQDVTEEIKIVMDRAETEEEKLEAKIKMIEEIESRIAGDTGLEVSVTPLFFGGRYSAYGYKRYEDVRLVFAPEQQVGAFGGDLDNFTYPRYNFDCAFFRVYDDDKRPLKTDNFFRWSQNGAEENEVVFTVGNPGRTNRLRTVAQLEYFRDISYPRTLKLLDGVIEIYNSLIETDPDNSLELEDRLHSFRNSLKAYTGMLKGLNDPVLMQRKRDFEKTFKSAVQSDKQLNEKYGGLWNEIEDINNELIEISNRRFALSLDDVSTPEYFYIAEELILIANELLLPESERNEYYIGDELEYTLTALMPEDFNYEMNNKLLNQKIDILYQYLGEDDELVVTMTGGNKGEAAVEYILSNSSLTNITDIKNLIDKGPEAILSGSDPFIYFVQSTAETSEKLDSKVNELTEIEDTYDEQLGRALFEVYGTSIPPDATFTLRLSDGIVTGFPYNGTIAPPFTTFYGMYDRYYSFDNEFPFSLPARWSEPPEDFDFSIRYNFVTTNDAVGGSSGSPVLNKNVEVVGVAFDGNIQGLPGSFIYRIEENRNIAVHSAGILEALKKIYNFDRLVKELETGELAK